MKKKVLITLLSAVIGLSVLTPSISVFADKISDLEKQRQKIANDKKAIDKQLKNTKEKIKAIENEKSTIDKQIEALDDSILDTTNRISDVETKISGMDAHLAEVEGHIAVLQEKINKRNELIRERAVSFQETGGSLSFLELIFGAQTFSQFVERVSSVSTIVKADSEILENQVSDQNDFIRICNEVKATKTELETMKNQFLEYKKKLATQKSQKDAIVQKLDNEQHSMENAALGMAEQTEILNRQKVTLEKLIAEEQKKGTNNTPVDVGGMFMVPAVGTYTSPFGSRWGSTHNGVDIANKTSVPILAAAGGVVLSSYYSSSYGNCVFLSHYINGKVYTTVYAHMSSRAVSGGQTVSRGQTLGMMGNTGRSFGQHLHFEIYEGEWTGDHRNAVNPLKYIKL
jgi:murein DD-endopeptidase MepM/ murein hydrolase activator NlpD